MAEVKAGDRVAIRFRAVASDRRILGSTDEGEPLVLTAGGEDVLYGLSHGVVGMSEGQRAVLLIDAEDAFGTPTEDIQRPIPKLRLPARVEVGDALRISSETTSIIMWVVGEGAGETWILSSQHPFAGQDIELHIEVVAIQ